jgi:aryl-alcohol dehydrogenase-like predicted oxidoreductase
LETLPVLYAHWPDDKTPVEELMDSLLRLKREGKILAIGLSNFSAAAVRRAVACGPVDVVQFQYSLIDRAGLAEVHPLLREHNIAAISWGALGRGLLTGKFTAETRFPEDDSRRCDAHFVGAAYRRNLQMAARVRAIAEQRGLAGSQVALRFVLDSPGITASLFGAKSPEQVEENRGALGWRLSPSEVAELKADPPADTPLATPGEAAA